MTTATRPRDVQVAEVGANTMVLRSRTWDRLKFEIEYARQKGTTANTYLIQADRIAVIDPPGESFTEIFLKELSLQAYLQKIDYVILSHVNLNRAATLTALLERAPQITFVCSKPGAIALKAAFPDRELNINVVRGDEVLDLGQGHELRFAFVPTPRHPGALCTFDSATRILYTDKLFGVHLCDDPVFDENWKDLGDDRRYYFDCLHASQAKQVETALDRISPFNARIYAPGHGPVVRFSFSRLGLDYRDWCEEQKNQETLVTMLYASAYGNTAAMAGAIAHGLTEAGVAVESINCEFADPKDITSAVEKSDGFIFGSPTLAGHAPTQIQTALGLVLSTAAKNKLAGVFGSYGWSGEAVDMLESRLQDAGFTLGFDTLRVKFKPTDAVLNECETAGETFAQTLRKTRKTRTSVQPGLNVQGDRTEQAVGRIVGSLCVLTLNQDNTPVGLLTSWVSQATFAPPGLTIALPFDQAEELLPQNGAPFVLNVLKEGRNVRRSFQKAIAPGENRFINLATHPATNGCPVLDDALAYMECKVQNRMKCHDHWLLYATIDNGKVLEPTGVTAVQHRKSATY